MRTNDVLAPGTRPPPAYALTGPYAAGVCAGRIVKAEPILFCAFWCAAAVCLAHRVCRDQSVCALPVGGPRYSVNDNANVANGMLKVFII